MRRTTASMAAASMLLLLAAAAAHSDAGRSAPHLKLVATAPPVVRASAFRAHERVRLVLRRRFGAPTISHASADSAGSFVATFAGVRVSRCGGFSIVATGSDGSRATMLRPMPLRGCSRGRGFSLDS
jgi:hypothetical protein